ncbi:heavy metal-associated isoprenylated plant protein 39-like isoform X2 [Wolffia australiana]
MAEKIVLKVDVADDKGKQKAMMAVSVLPGINFLSMNMKEKKMTVMGLVDPIKIIDKLRKHWRAEFVYVGPKEEPKKEEHKIEEPKIEEAKKYTEEHVRELLKLYQAYNPYPTTHYTIIRKQHDPNSCIIN